MFHQVPPVRPVLPGFSQQGRDEERMADAMLIHQRGDVLKVLQDSQDPNDICFFDVKYSCIHKMTYPDAPCMIYLPT